MHSLVFLILLLVVVMAPARASIDGSIAGVVTDTLGKPLIGAMIKIMGTTRGAYSKSDGRYIVERIRPGTYEIAISRFDFKPYKDSIIIVNNATAIVNVVLHRMPPDTSSIWPRGWHPKQAPKFNIFTGTVTDVEGSPLAGATVFAGNYMTLTNQNGVFQFVNLPDGKYHTRAHAPDFYSAGGFITITRPDTTLLTIVLLPTEKRELDMVWNREHGSLVRPGKIGTVRMIYKDQL